MSTYQLRYYLMQAKGTVLNSRGREKPQVHVAGRVYQDVTTGMMRFIVDSPVLTMDRRGMVVSKGWLSEARDDDEGTRRPHLTQDGAPTTGQDEAFGPDDPGETKRPPAPQ